MFNGYISVKTGRADYEVADVLRAYLPAYRAEYSLSAEQRRVCGSLLACRTAALGGHVDECSECGALEISYNSCRDRHCPKCGKYKKAQWIAKQKVVLLPVPYFHVVFTVDHLINPLVRANHQLLFNLLFEAATETLKGYALRYWGGEIGITAVLHTWGQTMNQHVHLHCIVTGGALSSDGSRWQGCEGRYLFPIVALSADYRDYFCKGVERGLEGGKVVLGDHQTEGEVRGWLDEMRAKGWEVHASYFTGPKAVYEYLSRYVHQVAISNYRIKGISQAGVRFSYIDNHRKDSKTGLGRPSEMTLSGVEFIRRFVWHILPDRFMRIRHYGLHHSRARKAKLPRCRELLGLDPVVPVAPALGLRDWLLTFIPEEELDRCAYCGQQRVAIGGFAFTTVPMLQMIFLTIFRLRGYQGVQL